MQTLLLVLLALAFSGPVQADVPPDHAQRMREGVSLFANSVRGTLEEKCLTCHGGDKVRGGFDMGNRDSLLEGGDSGKVLDLESPEDSYLLRLIRHDEEPTMPPSDKDKLSPQQISDLERWIRLGAPYDKPLIEKAADANAGVMTVTATDRDFWSFRPLSDPEIPNTHDEWANNEIDRFVARRLRQKGLTPNAPAGDRLRIRRTFLTLIGVPPTITQLNAALEMSHEQLVNELLESPHYGERWARHWLDAARFGESYGFEQDTDRRHAYHYRDFVIKALNADMPWDQFVRWQLAGDEIAPDEPMALMATGFLGAGVFPTQLTESEFERARYDELDDMAATVGTAMLGVTIGCARCHDHKFDPIPVKDYYRFISTFTTTIRSEIDVALDVENDRESLAEWQAEHEKRVTARQTYLSQAATRPAFRNWLRDRADSAEELTEEWNVLDLTELRSDNALTTLTRQADGAILATGKPGKEETYFAKAKTVATPIRFVRLEALTHASMIRNGPGRASNGNFGLGDLRVFVNEMTEDGNGTSKPRRRRLALKTYKFTHQQNSTNLSVASSVNDKDNKTGWAVDFGGIGKDQAAVFELTTPLELDGDVQLEFELAFAVNTAHSLGRFRISASNALAPSLDIGSGQSESTAAALAALKADKVEPRHRQTLLDLFLSKDDDWISLDKRVQESLGQKPVPKTTKVQVSSEGFPGIRHLAAGRGFKHFYPETHFLNRGDPNQKTGVATAGFLQVLMRNGKTEEHWQTEPPSGWKRTSYRRTGLANWISDTENGAGHLLARVAANRVWHHHFGAGIVATPNDFGLQGSLPTHPELLDHLARTLIDEGWSLKNLHRKILRSATWLQSSDASPDKSAIDPDNRFLWRFSPRRLEAEAVRDSLLAVSGQLDPTMFGPGTLDQNQQRRSIYFTIKRSRLIPMMQIFDQPEPLSSQGSRPATTIAPQALMFLNSKQVLSWASAFSKEVSQGNTPDAVKEVYLRTLGRDPTETEAAQSIEFIHAQAATYPRDGRSQALADFCQVMFGLNEFIYVR